MKRRNRVLRNLNLLWAVGFIAIAVTKCMEAHASVTTQWELMIEYRDWGVNYIQYRIFGPYPTQEDCWSAGRIYQMRIETIDKAEVIGTYCYPY